ncbi:2,3-diaminopropionate biosynthesis protein SbnB [Streptomyces sp. NPDC046860]|uniref:2,3-diaminopropionate biosynthesis protein SbnB n=1 Tax=Streptomyces sp. NPDC046860 TaxID=3154495 RepID=UPI003410A6AB
MLVIRHDDVAKLLEGRESELVDLVEETYISHEQGRSALPHSTFLRFPGNQRDRIIGLPAHLGGEQPAAGIKWIASFPENISRGLQRASAAIITNSMVDGRPTALIEGSLISARRTAASAAAAARALLPEGSAQGLALLGCGVINAEVLRFVTAIIPDVKVVTVYDPSPDRTEAFQARCRDMVPGLTVKVAPDAVTALAAHELSCVATNALTPHLGPEALRPGSVCLHLSLRDFTPEAVLASQNVVDDIDHVCRERTALDLAQHLSGGREFIDATVGQVLCDPAKLRRRPERPLLFSPFGLGILDLAVAEYVRRRAAESGLGIAIDDFSLAPAIR